MTQTAKSRRFLYCHARVSIYAAGLDIQDLHAVMFNLTENSLSLSKLASYNHLLGKLYRLCATTACTNEVHKMLYELEGNN